MVTWSELHEWFPKESDLHYSPNHACFFIKCKGGSFSGNKRLQLWSYQSNVTPTACSNPNAFCYTFTNAFCYTFTNASIFKFTV
jgi:hypothetical protein